MTETDRLLERLWILLQRLRKTETARVQLLDWDEPVGYDCRVFRWEVIAEKYDIQLESSDRNEIRRVLEGCPVDALDPSLVTQ